MKNDPEFAKSDYFSKMQWLRNVNDDIYDPSYTDMLRVAFTSEFRRGRLQDLVALLSGRNFETKQCEESIVEQSFETFRKGVHNFIKQTHFERFVMILRSAGFASNQLIRGQNAVNFAYIMYLRGRSENIPAAGLERIVRRWFVASMLTGRYARNTETSFDQDIRQLDRHGLHRHIDAVIAAEMSENFWSVLLPQQLETSSPISPYFLVYQAAQVELQDKGFLSRDIAVLDLILNHCDVYHVYPRNMLKKQGLSSGRYNQIANFVLAQSEINIAISDKSPEQYFGELMEQCHGGRMRYGGITDEAEMRANFHMSALPESLLDGEIPTYNDFLDARRHIMAQKIRRDYR